MLFFFATTSVIQKFCQHFSVSFYAAIPHIRPYFSPRVTETTPFTFFIF